MRAVVAAYLVVLGLLVTASLGVRERRVEKAFSQIAAVERVDMGVTLHVVRKSPDGKKVRRATSENIIRTHHLGGMVQIGGVPDGWDWSQGDPPSAFYVGPSERPVTWMCSEEQEPLILHDERRPLWSLIQGSEGAGKSVALVMWTALRVLEHVGRNVTGGITVPTTPRFRAVKKEAKKIWPKSWYQWRERDRSYQFHVGPSVQVVSAVQRSEESGSGLQGDSLEWCASDELQDHFAIEADIMSRGRGSDRYLRLCTSTSKDYSAWRDFRDIVRGSSEWTFTKLLGMASPFVDADFWHRIRRSGTVTEREWRRRYLAEDVGPEKQVYFNWRRTFENGEAANLAPIPRGAVDVTARELRTWGRNVVVLAGHDPGLRQHVTVFLKAYEMPRDKAPRWFVVGEVTSPEATIHGHIQEVKAAVARRWNAVPEPDRFGDIDPNAPTMLVRIDPATQSGEEHPGEDVFRAWRVAGLQAKPAAYAPGSSKGTPLKKRQRIDLINTLLAATAAVGEVRRLFVALVDGKAAAPMLVKAFETMETNEAGKAEAERKDANDLSHWPAATAFALWLIESRRLKWEPEEAAA